MYTIIVLDGHLASFSLSSSQQEREVSPSRNLPPFPIWTSMVSSTINSCRFVWDLIDNAKITVLISGNNPEVLVKWNTHHNRLLKINSSVRVQRAFEKSLELILSNNDQDIITSRILYIATGEEDTGYEFRSHQDNLSDIRTSMYLACQKLLFGDRLVNIQLDAIRILPKNIVHPIPPLSDQIMPGVTTTVYTIPNGEDDLRYTMCHLMQLYFDIDCINVRHYNITNTSMSNESDIESIKYYFVSNAQHFIKQKPIKLNVNSIAIYDPFYLSSRTITTSIIQNQYQIRESSDNNEWCTCVHPVTTINSIDEQAKSLLRVILNGDSIYLSSSNSNDKSNKIWDQVLVCIKDKVYLKCVCHDLDRELNISIPDSKVKQEITYVPTVTKEKVQEFMNTIIRPNLHQDISSILQNTNLIDYNAYQYSKLQNDYVNIKTTQKMEKLTKWRTCLRDGYQYPAFGIDNPKLNIHSLNGIKPKSYISTGYEMVSFGLINDLFDQLESAFIPEIVSNIASVESLVDMMVNELLAVTRNPKQKTLFSKKVDQQQTQSLALKCLASLYFIAIRFSDDSESHYKICERILNSIFDKEKPTQLQQDDDDEMDIKSSIMMKKKGHAINMAWEQATRYQNMTHREKADAVTDIGTINPNFRGRRQKQQTSSPSSSSQQQQQQILSSKSNKKIKTVHRYPDPSIAVPYLEINYPTWDEVQKDKKMSTLDSNNLLGQFWMTASKEIHFTQEFDGRKPLLNTEDSNNHYKNQMGDGEGK
ncbi:unnamed protein product [Cunninghamella blakesleeana]